VFAAIELLGDSGFAFNDGRISRIVDHS